MQPIADWLEKLGLSEYAERFAENGISVAALPHLTDHDLKDIGVLLGHRRVMLAAISKLAGAAPATPESTALAEPKPLHSPVTGSSVRLGPSLKDHVERPRRRPSNPRKPAVANDFGELGLTRLRTQAFAYFLV
jgi:SAM domain (Sterile alpha motif)